MEAFRQVVKGTHIIEVIVVERVVAQRRVHGQDGRRPAVAKGAHMFQLLGVGEVQIGIHSPWACGVVQPALDHVAMSAANCVRACESPTAGARIINH